MVRSALLLGSCTILMQLCSLGIQVEEARAAMTKAGFERVKLDHVFDIHKEVDDKSTRSFPFILCSACKPAV